MKQIVLIDDSEIILMAASLELTEAGYEVKTMTQPSRALLTGDPPPALVLVDVNMPEAFGDDVAHFFRQQWEVKAPIYLYSSLSEQELAHRAKQAEADGYICKSWGLEQLVTIVDQIVGGGDMSVDAAGEAAEGSSSMSDDAAASAAGTAGGELDGTIFQRFADRCSHRGARIVEQLKATTSCTSEESASLLSKVKLELHDWIGESRLLDFAKLAEAAKALHDALDTLDEGLGLSALENTTESWITRLVEVSREVALTPPSAEITAKVQSLRTDIESELASREFSEDAQTPTTLIGEEEAAAEVRRILVFDDSPIVGDVIGMELKSRGHLVALAEGYEQFKQELESFAPEVIFLDINMPEVKGDEVCRRLRQQAATRHIPVVFLSSLPEEELATLAEQAGASGYLSKQRGIDDLISYLDDLLSQVIF